MADEPSGEPVDQPSLSDSGEPAVPTKVGPKLIKSFMAEVRGGFPGGTFLDKLTSKQLDRVLDQNSEESRRQHELDLQFNRMVFSLLLSIPILILLLCFVFLHYGKGDLLREIIALLVGLAGGGAGGFSIGKATSRTSNRSR